MTRRNYYPPKIRPRMRQCTVCKREALVNQYEDEARKPWTCRECLLAAAAR